MGRPTIADRVALGAAYLDEHFPAWPRLITVERLDISSGCRCVLGQLHGEEYPSIGELPGESSDLSTASAARTAMGFQIAAELGPDETYADYRQRSDDEYASLTLAWQRCILARRHAADDAEFDRRDAVLSRWELLFVGVAAGVLLVGLVSCVIGGIGG